MRSVQALAAAVLSLLAVSQCRARGEEAGRHPADLSSGQPGPAPRSTRRRPTRSTFPSCRSSTISSSTNRTSRKTAWSRSSRISRRAGPGAATARRSTFKLRQGVKWHDGKPFTSNDVKCTFDMLMGKSPQKFRKNPRKSWYDEVVDVTTNGDFEVAFNLKRPQPALLALLASGYTPIYPCHVSPARNAHPPDRHRSVQVRRVQGQRIDQAHPQSGLLEEGPAASRRHRVHHHPEPFDRDPGVCRRQVRHDVPDRGIDPAAQGRQGAGAERDLRGRADQRQHQHHRQLVRRRRSTIWTFAARWRWRSIARPSSRS